MMTRPIESQEKEGRLRQVSERRDGRWVALR